MSTKHEEETRFTHRRTGRRWTGIAAIGALLALVTSPQGPLGGFWGAPSVDELGIQGGALAALLAYGLLEAVGFGLGLAWLFTATPMLKLGPLARATYVSMAWLLVSWYPHGALHQKLDHHDWAGLARIEWGFHATMVVAAIIVGNYLWRAGAVDGSAPARESRA
ncbi:hypothetical protein [Isoptericola croceus]|uniref:hypothetical protein n=1 Tax=Isoptericola croceus TaxID=3031406 RepID=UPI0023F9444F|nr:hypothetical protein [Isoptericola croceus]